MRRFCLVLGFCAAALGAAAQNTALPQWVSQLPRAENSTYYFRVTHADGDNYEKAYVRAFAMAILESSWKNGLPVEAKNDLAAIEHGVENNLTVRSHQSNVALNKVCEYQTRNVSTGKVELYVLWQVAAAGNIEPRFEEFNKCR